MTVEELIELVDEECKKKGYHYMVQIDDGEHITGQYHVVTNSRLHNMARAVNGLTDSHEEAITQD